MALIKCPECGKDVSEKASSCPNCGCPNSEFSKRHHVAEELPEDEKPEMFNCIECSRPLPIGIEECVYCHYVYRDNYQRALKEESKTGILGRKGLACPECGSRNVEIENDIPAYRKAFDLITFGGIMPTTKHEYRKDMCYHCRSCGNTWKQRQY